MAFLCHTLGTEKWSAKRIKNIQLKIIAPLEPKHVLSIMPGAVINEVIKHGTAQMQHRKQLLRVIKYSLERGE